MNDHKKWDEGEYGALRAERKAAQKSRMRSNITAKALIIIIVSWVAEYYKGKKGPRLRKVLRGRGEKWMKTNKLVLNEQNN